MLIRRYGMLTLFVSLSLLAASALQTQANPPDFDAKMRQAQQQFQSRAFDEALKGFREAIALQPNSVLAHNLAGNCALQLKDYPQASTEFKRALELQPDEWHNVAGLIQAYALAGDSKQQAAEIQHILQLQRNGAAPPTLSFFREQFTMLDRTVQVLEYPQLTGQFHFRYLFMVLDAQGRLMQRIALESDDIDQVTFAKEHPKEAAAGGRQFSLDSYTHTAQGGTHGTIRFYHLGEPSYEAVLADVKTVVSGQRLALAPNQLSNEYPLAPNPARLAGAPPANANPK